MIRAAGNWSRRAATGSKAKANPLGPEPKAHKRNTFLFSCAFFYGYVHGMFSSLAKQNVTYFGLWADECRDEQMAKAALGILRDAIARCEDDDVRSAELDEVLAWIDQRSIRKNPVHRFRDALGIAHPHERKAALADAYVRILRELGLFSGRL